jgi:CBS domain-containing protein
MPTAEEMMVKNVITFRPSDKLSRVSKSFAKHGISGAPVVDDRGKVIGVISEHDIIKLGEKLPSVWTPLDHHLPLAISLSIKDYKLEKVVKALKEVGTRKVEEVMSKKVLTASPKTGLGEIARMMEKHKINRIPIVDKKGKLLGLVARADVIEAFWKHKK